MPFTPGRLFWAATRALLVLAAGYALLLSADLWLVAEPLSAVRATGRASYDDAVTVAAGVAALIVLTWLAAGTAIAVVVQARRADRPPLDRRSATPWLAGRMARRLASALLGISLMATPGVAAAPAGASAPPLAAASSASTSGAPTLAGWSPDRPAAPDRPSAAEHADPVTVRRGDTLWRIAARRLGPEATDADVARTWPRWHAANRPVIGPDPDLLQPGQRLRPPRGQTVPATNRPAAPSDKPPTEHPRPPQNPTDQPRPMER